MILSTFAKKNVVTMAPTTLAQVEHLVQTRTLWKLGASGLGACRRIVRDAIADLPARYQYATQTEAFLLEKGRLERLLEKLEN